MQSDCLCKVILNSDHLYRRIGKYFFDFFLLTAKNSRVSRGGIILYSSIFVCLICVLTSQSTAMVMSKLITFFFLHRSIYILLYLLET